MKTRTPTLDLLRASLDHRPSRACRRLLAALAVVFVAGLPLEHVAYARKVKWVATWGAAPVLLSGGSTPSLANQSIRETAHISAGGDAIRIRLTNEIGAGEVLIGAAHVAIAGPGDSIEPGTDREVTFGGSPTVVLRAGAPMLSDPVDLPVEDLETLAVSLFLPNTTTPIVGHSVARASTFVSAPGSGDTTAAVDFPATSQTTLSFLLSQIDVERRGVKRVIVTLGDSITDGEGSSLDGNARWPDALAERLKNGTRDLRHAVVNAGITGNQLLRDQPGSPRFGANALARIDRDVLAVPGVTHVIVLEGIDDIEVLGSATADEVIAGYRQLIDRAHARGVKVIGGTLTPTNGFSAFTPAGETRRQTVNAFIRTGGAFDGVADFDAIVRDPADQSRLRPELDSGDHFHPNDDGYRAMAEGIDLKLLK